jgi:branched-chain amino acid transport system permease protein
VYEEEIGLDANALLFQQSLWSGLTIGFVYGLVALGFTLIYNVSKVLNIAQGEFVMVGALSLYSFVTVFNTPIWLAVILALIVSGIVGGIMVKLAIEPLKKPEILTLIIATVAFGEIIKGFAVVKWGSNHYAIPSIFKTSSVTVFSAEVNSQTFVIIGVSLLIYFGLMFVNKKTNFGISLTAIANDPYAAQLMGINIKKMTILVFVIGSAMGALGGVLIGPMTTMSYFQGTMLGIKAFIAALIGGLGSYGGAIVGGLVLGLFEAFATGYFSTLFQDAYALSLLLVILVFLPKGLVDIKKLFKWKRL